MTMSITSHNTCVHQIPALDDNYIYVIEHKPSQSWIAIDPGTEIPLNTFLQSKNAQLSGVLITHHHWDHIDGLKNISEKYNCPIVASKNDSHRIPHANQWVSPPCSVTVGGLTFQSFHIPGHTLGHISYYLPEQHWLFSGDTLFSLGCGRLFEGTPAQMLLSLQKIRTLPPETLIFCTHEYTVTNTRFALSLQPDNIELQEHLRKVESLREKNISTIPTRLDHECRLNPFLKWDCPELRKSLNLEFATALEVFTHIRELRNTF